MNPSFLLQLLIGNCEHIIYNSMISILPIITESAFFSLFGSTNQLS